MTAILALDPGPTETGYCYYQPDATQAIRAGVLPNSVLLARLPAETRWTLAIEMVASYGMPVGREVFETVVWIGRFQQASVQPEAVHLVPRLAVKLHHCQSARAKDANIWQAILDRFGGAAAARRGGPLHGVRSHARAALALALTVADGAVG